MEPVKNSAPARPADVLKIIELIATLAMTLVAFLAGHDLWLHFFGNGRP